MVGFIATWQKIVVLWAFGLWRPQIMQEALGCWVTLGCTFVTCSSWAAGLAELVFSYFFYPSQFFFFSYKFISLNYWYRIAL